MSSKITNTCATERPTLPSIHMLALPMPAPLKQANVKYASHDNAYDTPTNHGRNVSTSSSATIASRSSPSPSPQDVLPSRASAVSPTTPTKFRLVPSSMETADAFIYVPPQGTYVPTATNYAARTGKGQGILLVGSSVQQLRRSPPRPLAKGARLHPYRIVRGEQGAPLSRRTSIVSITSFPTTS